MNARFTSAEACYILAGVHFVSVRGFLSLRDAIKAPRDGVLYRHVHLTGANSLVGSVADLNFARRRFKLTRGYFTLVRVV